MFIDFASKINLSPLVALAAVESKAVVMLLLIHCCSHCLWGFNVMSLVCYAIVSLRKGELVALLQLIFGVM